MDYSFLYISFFLTIGSFLVGFLISWNIKAAFDEWQSKADYAKIVMHPEMYDQHGNLIPDEIVAFRFENNYDYETEDNSEEDD